MRFIMEHDGEPSMDSTALVSSAWVVMDPAAAIAFSGTNGFPFQDQMVKDWATIDPQAAWAWAMKEPSDALTNGELVLIGIAMSSPEELGKLLFEMPNEEYGEWEAGLGHLLDLIANDPVMMERIVSGVPESQRDQIYGAVSKSMRDPEQVFQFLKKHPEAAKYSRPSVTFRDWVNQPGADPAAALAELPPGELQKEGAIGMIRGTAHRDPAQALAIMERYPYAVTDKVRLQVIKTFGKIDPALALAQAPAISDPEQRQSAVIYQLRSWLKKNPEAAENWLISHPQPAAILDELPPQN